MRPDPNDRSTGPEPARIIYLGEVRRRRASRRTAPDRHYLAAIGLIGLVAWGLWLTVVISLQPARLLTYLAFFIPLWLACTCTATLTVYAVDWRRGLLPSLPRAVIRGVVVAIVIIANLAMVAAHEWSIVVAGGTIVVVAAIDTLLERRVTTRL